MCEPRIDYYTELIQTIIYLADVKDKIKQNVCNRTYCDAIDLFFTNFRNHAAVSSTREMIQNKYFRYSRPHRAAARFDQLLEEKTDLTEWAKRIKEFEEASDFAGFFKRMREYYDGILKKVTVCPVNDWKKYIDDYFGACSDLNVIVCLLDGNYGFVEDGKAFIVCCVPLYTENGPTIFTESSFAKGIAHEYAHCFVNPIVEKHQEKLKDHADFFHRHKDMFSFYNVDYAVVNEYFARAFAIRFMEKMSFEGFDLKAEYERQRKTFPYIDRFTKSLKRYERSTDSFEDNYLSELPGLLR